MSNNIEASVVIRGVDKIDPALKNAEKKVGNFSNKVKGLKPTFKKMALIGSAAFAGVNTAVFKATQSASDAQEIFNKFDVVFGNVSNGAEKVAQDLRKNFGLAESSAKKLLSSTGDMLTGFGLSGESALDLAEKTNKLAVDLASFTNIEGGAERASAALTKALLGERESVKELGIAILEEDVKAKIEAMEIAGKFTNETDRQKKAYATLEIAIEQSKNAIGDFARTQDSLANQQRTLKERTKELSEALGNTFIPMLTKIVEKLLPIVNKMSEWISANPELTKNILLAIGAITGLVAVFGTLGLVLPKIIIGVKLLMGAFSPWGFIIAGIITGTILIIKNFDKIKSAGKELFDAIGGSLLGIENKVIETVDRVVNKFKEMIEAVKNAVNKVKEFASNFGGSITGFFGGIGEKVGGAVTGVLGFADGGVVPGPIGAPVPAIVHGGETVIPNGGRIGAGNVTVNILGGNYLSNDAAEMLGNKIIDRLKFELRF